MFGLFGGKKKKKHEVWARSFTGSVQNFEFSPSLGLIDSQTTEFRGNTYVGDTNMIHAIDKAYNGVANWGVNLTKAVIDIRAAMIGGAGVEVGITEGFSGDATKEIEFVKNFMTQNAIHPENQVAWAVEGGIEGRALFILRPVTKTVDGKVVKYVKSTFVPRNAGPEGGSYKVKTSTADYTEIESVEISPNNGQAPYTIKYDKFSYAKFGGRISRVNCSTPIVGHVMPQIEAIDHALRDWREINNLYAQPTPTVECQNAEDARIQYETMTTVINWKIGKLLVIGGGAFKMVGPEIQGVQSIMDELTTNLKIVSGTTGIPPHFLGFPDLMQNRATADSLTEVMFAATARERLAWIQLYTDQFRKALLISNRVFGTSYNPEAVTAMLPENAQTRLRQIVDIWLPIYKEKGITRKTFLKRVPGIDADKESKEVVDSIEKGEYDGVKPGEDSGQLGQRKPGKGSPDPDNTRSKTQLEKRTTGAGRNAK